VNHLPTLEQLERFLRRGRHADGSPLGSKSKLLEEYGASPRSWWCVADHQASSVEDGATLDGDAR
jgi:hypothetical protein